MGIEVIVPNARFHCNGRITHFLVSIYMLDWNSINTPSIQIWRPTSVYSSTYVKIGEVQLPEEILINSDYENENYYYNIKELRSHNQLEFQPGDVIGYYQPYDSQQVIRSIVTNEYISYIRNTDTATSLSALVDINSVVYHYTRLSIQPLIEVYFGKVMFSI